MERKIYPYTVLIGCLSLLLLLALTTVAQAQVQAWSGSANVKVTLTTNQEIPRSIEGLGYKLVKSTETIGGTMTLYWDPLTRKAATGGPNNCFTEFTSNDGATEVCVTNLFNTDSRTVSAATRTLKVSVLYAGEGTFSTAIKGTPYTGFVYISATGSMVFNEGGTLVSGKAAGTISGGCSDPGDTVEYIFTGTIPSTILRMEP